MPNPNDSRRQQRGPGRGKQREPSEYEEEVLQIDRVTRVVKGGRRLRFRATVVVGNKKGKVGIGIGKSNEVVGAIQKAIRKAKRDMVLVPLINDTIPHEIKTKFKSARIILMPASPGTGIIAGGAVRKIAELSGIKNLLSKMVGGNNRITNAKATIRALSRLQTTKQDS
ncbi:30S ribosomal protein S5 [Candidatus Peregrinibacteria bacterium CG_4_9_14_0_2_um_filter_53_11]|nr:MAG: 30S ribosomal protein S5 [Candidatus Peregrinibacteria bacterium CG_4_9_14_0_2_um_filter_53_11]